MVVIPSDDVSRVSASGVVVDVPVRNLWHEPLLDRIVSFEHMYSVQKWRL